MNSEYFIQRQKFFKNISNLPYDLRLHSEPNKYQDFEEYWFDMSYYEKLRQIRNIKTFNKYKFQYLLDILFGATTYAKLIKKIKRK